MKCKCECGQITSINKTNDFLRGFIKGEPKVFIWGHNNRKPPKTVETIVCDLLPSPPPVELTKPTTLRMRKWRSNVENAKKESARNCNRSDIRSEERRLGKYER